ALVADAGEEQRVGDAVMVGEAPDHLAITGGVAGELIGQTDDLQASLTILAIPRRQQRRLVIAVRAPRSEDVDQHDLPAKALVAERDRLSGEIGKAEPEPAFVVRQADVLPTIRQRGAGVVGPRGGPGGVVGVARPVVAGEPVVVLRGARLKEKGVGSVEGGEAKNAILERPFEIAIVTGGSEERSGDAVRTGILMKLAASGRDAVGV